MAQINRIGPNPYNQDPLDVVSKALTIAGSVYGIKEASAKAAALDAETKQKQAAFDANQNGVLSPKDLADYGKSYKISNTPVPGALPFKQMINGQQQDIYLTPKQPDSEDAYKKKLEILDLEQKLKNNVNNTPGKKSTDEAFAKDYVDWNAAGGYAGVQKQLNLLQNAANVLSSDQGQGITGVGPGIAGFLGIRSATNPQAVALKQGVEQAVQSTLRATLGSQFTENEGKRILKNTFDESLPPEENAKKLQNTIAELDAIAKSKDAASKYFEQNGTLSGFTPATNRSQIAQNNSANPNNAVAAQAPVPAGITYQDLLNEKIRRQGIGGALAKPRSK